jgi:general secretion pathway protein K
VSRRESGVAVITAILVVAVAASAATLMLAQQSAMVDQAMLITSRAQGDLYARAGIDWARGVLQEDSRTGKQLDYLGEAWAQPIAALPVERALVSGTITDEQGKLNLNSLVGTYEKESREAFVRLLASQGLAPELADAVVDWIDDNADLSGPGGAEDAYYLSLRKPYRAANAPMVQVEELYRVRGFDAATVRKLRPYVSALPVATKVNVNTAPEALVYAMFPQEIARAAIARFLTERRTKPATTIEDLSQRFKQSIPGALPIDVRSDFFSVRVQVSQDEVEIASEALVQRAVSTGAPSMVWLRPRY